MTSQTLITGFPRIGENRELKKALEGYWAGKTTEEELQNTAAQLREKHWSIQKNASIDLISVNDFSFYDGMLDTIEMLNAIPQRFRDIDNRTKRYFAMARGDQNRVAMEMTKWFNTNYHYIVPELDDSIQFSLNDSKIISEYQQAASLNIKGKINIIGPLTFLGLSKSTEHSDPYDYYENVIKVYENLFTHIAKLDNCVYVQMDEPVFVKGSSSKHLNLLDDACWRLSSVSDKIRLIVTTYFDHSCEATRVIANTPVWGIGLDFVNGEKNFDALSMVNKKYLVAGVVDGRNVWVNNLKESLDKLEKISGFVNKERVIVATSCSLLHVPYSVNSEPDSEVKKWLAFSIEKVDEVALLGRIFNENSDPEKYTNIVEKNTRLLSDKAQSEIVKSAVVTERLKTIRQTAREGKFSERIALQQSRLNLPILPTTTIGSFPQTPQLRKIRKLLKNGSITVDEYEMGIREYIDECIGFQERAGIDILVHGEPERNDMVEYFGGMMNGFHITRNGWVQSYGSRCVKPPIIYGDISRSEPMTVKWITYAQNKTGKPVKGMLTGPVTILNWSFVRNDLPKNLVSKQIAVALSDEIADLQKAGISIVQVDEAAFKEGYPLRKSDVPLYEQWAVDNFKLAVSSARKDTQIHTHMCYSEFNDCIKTIEALDADVITIETARSGNELLRVFRETGYANEIGPGVYDIHSPRIPAVDEFVKEIKLRLDVVAADKMWINPDCGLKTRKWDEVIPALENMAKATEKIRLDLAEKV